jgi:hypothetical protein
LTVPIPDNDWQRIWFATRQKDWSSLAIIPTHAGIDVAHVAQELTATGLQHGERPVALLNAVGVKLVDTQNIVDSLAAMTGRATWVLVPVDPLADNPSSVAVVRAAAAALLVVRLGQSFLSSARNTIDLVGRERFLGSIALDADGGVHGVSLQPSER